MGSQTPPTANRGNAVRTLAGEWRLATDPGNLGRDQRWFDSIRAEARPAPVPGIIQQVFPGYHGVAWYWHQFRAARPASAHERCLLRFGAVDYLADVWMNGIHVGNHEGGETPFALDVTHVLRPDADNLLAVRVLNPTDEPIDGIRLAETPHRNKRDKDYQPGASLNHGGIMLPVDLVVVPAVRITDLFVRPQADSGHIRVTATIRNDEEAAAAGRLTASVAAAHAGEVLGCNALDAQLLPGETTHELSLSVAEPRLWSLEDPFLYSARLTLEATSGDGNAFSHARTVRCGFRDFRVVKGYFRLNGKRIFVRSTHTGNHFPIGQQLPPNPDMLRRDLLYAKACGFNMVRFIAGLAHPEQLDFCDEIGLMVYEESYAGWCMEDSPQMAGRFDRSIREMILRDRNHPSVAIWGLLNETPDGAVFRRAVQSLSMVRSLDDTRLVLLNSGRWDCQWGIGSLSNPGSTKWEHHWGDEAPGAPAAPSGWDSSRGGYLHHAGDAHVYPRVPHPRLTINFLRTLAADTKPVFLSEYGIGSLLDVIRGLRKFEECGARADLDDAALFRSMTEKLEADWQRFGMEGVYPFLEDMLRDSQRLHIRQRLLGFDLVRSNPKLCGFNVTGMLDHGITGEGLWTFWREWKPGIADALADGWAALRWCLFVDPMHGYAGRPIVVEAVLGNEDVLPPGEYPVRFRITGPAGVAWERSAVVSIPRPAAGEDGPLAVPVLREEVMLNRPAGEYEFAASMERGGAPAGGRLRFRLADTDDVPRLKGTVAVWGIDDGVQAWLRARGIRCRPLRKTAPGKCEVILVGNPKDAAEALPTWTELARRMAQGSTVLFLSPLAFRRGDSPVFWLPLEKKGRCYEFSDWLYHKECVAKAHPIFDGLQCGRILDWDYYDQVIPHHLFDGQDTPDDVAAAAFAVGYSRPGGYASGVLVGAYEFAAGRFVLNTMRVLEHIDTHPAADRLLLNFIRYAQHGIREPSAPLPSDFDSLLRAIGYPSAAQ
jgi:hypothetical protein